MDNGSELSLSFKWLKCGHLKTHTEAQAVAAQDQALAVRAVQNHIYGMCLPLNHRVCGTMPEYVEHLLSGCTPLTATMYKQRHDRIARIVHWNLLKHFNKHVSCEYWKYVPSAVVDSSEVKVLWNFNIYTDHVLSA